MGGQIESAERKELSARIYLWQINPLKIIGEVKIFPDKQRLRKFTTSRITLQEMLKMASLAAQW